MKKNLVLVSWWLLAVAGSASLVSARGEPFGSPQGKLRRTTQVREEWVARYNGPGNARDDASAMALDADGNVYVTGSSEGVGTLIDYATVKYDADGNELWLARYNGPGNGEDWAVAIALDPNGNVYVTGRSWGVGTGYDYATIKYDSAGNELWVARYTKPWNGSDEAHAIALDAAGNVYVTGSSWGGPATNFEYATIKYDADGNELWLARYNGPGNGEDWAVAIALDPNGNVYVTGWSAGFGTGYDYATIKYDADGNELWVARYTGPENGTDWAHAIALDADSNVYVTGRSCGTGAFPECLDYATIKYDPAGNELWLARYTGPGNGSDEARAIALDPNGNVYVTGSSWGVGIFWDYATVKYDADGNELWVARYNGPENGTDWASAIALDAAGNVYVTGGSLGVGTNYDYATIKYDSAGNELSVARYNGPGNGLDSASAMALDANGNVYVTGLSEGMGTGWDYATIKYAQK